MAKILDIKYETKMPRYRVYFYLENPTIAKYYYDTCLYYVSNEWRSLILYYKSNKLILDGPIVDKNGSVSNLKKKKVEKVAHMLKKTIQKDTP